MSSPALSEHELHEPIPSMESDQCIPKPFTEMADEAEDSTTVKRIPEFSISGQARVQFGDQHYHQYHDPAKDLLHSLHFPEIFRRYDNIDDNCPGTFKWMFDKRDTGPHVVPWESFTEWLQTDASSYWVSGNPGSGKLTLMKYAHYNVLQQCQNATSSVIVSF